MVFRGCGGGGWTLRSLILPPEFPVPVPALNAGRPDPDGQADERHDECGIPDGSCGFRCHGDLLPKCHRPIPDVGEPD